MRCRQMILSEHSVIKLVTEAKHVAASDAYIEGGTLEVNKHLGTFLVSPKHAERARVTRA